MHTCMIIVNIISVIVMFLLMICVNGAALVLSSKTVRATLGRSTSDKVNLETYYMGLRIASDLN